jgi:hypothetical protein
MRASKAHSERIVRHFWEHKLSKILVWGAKHEYSIWANDPLKSASNIRISSFVPPSKSSFGTHKTHFLLFSLPKSLLFLLSTFVSTFSCAFHPSLRFRGANAERATLLLATTNGSATCSSM